MGGQSARGGGAMRRGADLPADGGFAGFRLHAALNKPDYYDELAVFQGASYWRALVASGGKNLDVLVAPPPAVLAAYQSLPKTDDYADLPSSIRARG